MTSQRKRVVEMAMSLNPHKKSFNDTDYTKCIICQEGQCAKELCFIKATTKFKLIKAMSDRQGEFFHRLYHETNSENWLDDNEPRWHQKCRNWYKNEKSDLPVFECQRRIFVDKTPELGESGKVIVDHATSEKAIMMSQHLL